MSRLHCGRFCLSPQRAPFPGEGEMPRRGHWGPMHPCHRNAAVPQSPWPCPGTARPVPATQLQRGPRGPVRTREHPTPAVSEGSVSSVGGGALERSQRGLSCWVLKTSLGSDSPLFGPGPRGSIQEHLIHLCDCWATLCVWRSEDGGRSWGACGSMEGLPWRSLGGNWGFLGP